MPRFNLATLSRRTNRRRRSITLPVIATPQMLAIDLYQSCYRPIIDLWKNAAPRIVSEYERTIATMTADSPADVQNEIDEAANEALRLYLTLTPSLRNWTFRVEQIIRNRWRGAILSATGVDLGTLLGPQDVRDTLEAYLNWNADLIRDVSDEIKKRVADRVFSGLTQRKPVREVAKEINEAVGLGRKRSQRIAQDQLSKISTSLADERRREAGIDTWAWVHSQKKHPRKEHQARDGNIYADVPGLVGKKVGDKVVMTPPERGDRPGQAPYCGCRSRSVLIWDDEE